MMREAGVTGDQKERGEQQPGAAGGRRQRIAVATGLAGDAGSLMTIARLLARCGAARREEHQVRAQQSTSKRQMRWISTDFCISRTWFSLVRADGAAEWNSCGTIQRSEIGSYHLPGLTKFVSPV
jgi:hypothetical protein